MEALAAIMFFDFLFPLFVADPYANSFKFNSTREKNNFYIQQHESQMIISYTASAGKNVFKFFPRTNVKFLNEIPICTV